MKKILESKSPAALQDTKVTDQHHHFTRKKWRDETLRESNKLGEKMRCRMGCGYDTIHLLGYLSAAFLLWSYFYQGDQRLQVRLLTWM